MLGVEKIFDSLLVFSDYRESDIVIIIPGVSGTWRNIYSSVLLGKAPDSDGEERLIILSWLYNFNFHSFDHVLYMPTLLTHSMLNNDTSLI